MIQLTWADLLIEDFSADEAQSWLAEWSWMVSGQVAPVCLSKFGDWFLRRPDGRTEVLDVLEGELSTVAHTPEAFAALMNDQDWQEERLLSELIHGFHERGIIPQHGQCYGFAPHPLQSGAIDPACVAVFDTAVWQAICAQVLRGVTVG